MSNNDPFPWLLEPDPANPGVRYFALVDLLERPEDDPEVQAARQAIMQTGPVPAILDAQYPDGYWVKPGGGYSPKYRGTVWQILFLAELGADPADERVRRGCEYVLGHSIAPSGAFSAYQKPVNSGTVHCLNGNLLWALQQLGFGQDERVQRALDWQARAITGEEDFKYLKSATCGPGFACSVNEGQPCAWGANKAMRALLAVPPDQCTAVIERAIQAGVEFLLSRDPAVADYPYTQRVSSTWFKFGFPLSYWSDVLETVDVLGQALGRSGNQPKQTGGLARAGARSGDRPQQGGEWPQQEGDRPQQEGEQPQQGGERPRQTGNRLANAIELILSKQDEQGRWKLENALTGKMWADIEQKGRPSKWVTLRVLRVLKRAAHGYHGAKETDPWQV